MSLSRNKKNNVYPCKIQFYYVKWGLRGSKLYRYVFVMLVPYSKELEPYRRNRSTDQIASTPFAKLLIVSIRMFAYAIKSTAMLDFYSSDSINVIIFIVRYEQKYNRFLQISKKVVHSFYCRPNICFSFSACFISIVFTL